MHLWAPDGPENHINRKNIIFYIETIPQKFSQLRKKIEKNFDRDFFHFFFDEIFHLKNPTKNWKFQIFDNIFFPKIWNFRFFVGFFAKNFRRKKMEKNRSKNFSIFFRSWEKFRGIVSMYKIMIFRFMWFSGPSGAHKWIF